MVTRQRKNNDKGKAKSAKLIWRISATAPLGEYVRSAPEEVVPDPVEAKPKTEAGPPEITERGWHHSSRELVQGMDMSEEPLDTLPNALFDQLFKKEP